MLSEVSRSTLEDYLKRTTEGPSIEFIRRLSRSQNYNIWLGKQRLLVHFADLKIGGYNQQNRHWFIRCKFLASCEQLDKKPWHIPFGFVWQNHPLSNPHIRIEGEKAPNVFEQALLHFFEVAID